MEATARRLMRSRRDRVFGGICGGLADYLGWDVVLVRVGYVVLTLFSGGTGIPLYFLAWILVPLEDLPSSLSEIPVRPLKPTSARVTVGVFVAAVGLLALISSFFPWFTWWHHMRLWGPLLLILLGMVMLIWRPDAAEKAGGSPTGSSESPTDAPPQPTPVRHLVRVRQGRKIAGVCTGIGEYLNVDPTIVRLIFIILLFTGGVAVPLYLILWVAMPLEKV
jgi:phage shock protein C